MKTHTDTNTHVQQTGSNTVITQWAKGISTTAPGHCRRLRGTCGGWWCRSASFWSSQSSVWTPIRPPANTSKHWSRCFSLERSKKFHQVKVTLDNLKSSSTFWSISSRWTLKMSLLLRLSSVLTVTYQKGAEFQQGCTSWSGSTRKTDGDAPVCCRPACIPTPDIRTRPSAPPGSRPHPRWWRNGSSAARAVATVTAGGSLD